MVADNNLFDHAPVSLQQMEQSFSETGVNLIVFIDQLNEDPQLLEIHKGEEKLVRSYSELNSSDTAVFNTDFHVFYPTLIFTKKQSD